MKKLLRKFTWVVHDFLERKLDNCKYGNQTYDFRKWLYFKVFKMDKLICHFCLKKLSPNWEYYCRECAEETC